MKRDESAPLIEQRILITERFIHQSRDFILYLQDRVVFCYLFIGKKVSFTSISFFPTDSNNFVSQNFEQARKSVPIIPSAQIVFMLFKCRLVIH